jgi:hypothetical protein
MKINKLLKNWFKSPFWKGVATVSDITGSLSTSNSRLQLTKKDKQIKIITSKEADYLALLSDWEAVGNDLRTAIQRQKAN